MKEILIPLNFTTTPTVYDTKQSFSTSDEASGVLTFTTTADVAGTVASLTIRNANENANRQTVLIKRLDVNSSPFSYTLKKPLPFGQYEGTILLKKNLTVIASATFLFGVNSSLAAEVLPDLVKAYALDELVENVETEVSNLKDAFTLTVSETVKGVNKTESTMQLSENVRYLAEESRKVNNLLWKTQAEAHALAEEGRVTEFGNLVDSAVIEQTVAQEVANEFQEIEATYANRLLSTEQQLAQIHINVKDFGAVGDGVTDDRLAIQNAIDSLNGTGGTIYFPPTPNFYALKSKHPIHSTYLYIDNPGINFITGSQGIVSATLKPTIKAVGDSLDSVVLLSNKAWHIKMDGIYVHGGANRCVTGIKSDGWITRCEFNNVKVTHVNFACFDIRGYLLAFNHCISAYSNNKGFYIHGSLENNVEGTTTVLNACFAMNCNGIGYHLHLMTYSSIHNSGADGCGVGYFLEQTTNVSLNTNGSEQTVEPIHLRLANYTTIDGFTVYNKTIAATPKIKGVIQTIQTGSWYVNISNINVQSGLIGSYFDYLLYIHTATSANFVVLDKTVRKTVIYDLSSDGVTFPLYKVKTSGATYVDGWSGNVQSTLDSFGRVTIVGRVTVGNTTKGTIAALDTDVKPKIVTTFSGYDVSGGSVNRAVHGFYVSDTGNLGYNGVPSDLSIGRDIHINTSYTI